MHNVQESTENIVTFKVGEKLTQAEMEDYVRELKEAIARWGSVRVMLIMEGFPTPELGALWKDIKFSSQHLKDIKRMALVGDKAWQSWYAKLTDLLVQTEVKHFDPAEVMAAWDWLRA